MTSLVSPRRESHPRIKAAVAALLATVAAALVGLGAGAAPAQADQGVWCYVQLVYQGGSCYSGWESDLKSIKADSNYSYTWAWLYNQANGGHSNFGYCTYALGCVESVGLASAGHGYQELAPYGTAGPNPDYFYGSWFS
jgi:hypothetical protein